MKILEISERIVFWIILFDSKTTKHFFIVLSDSIQADLQWKMAYFEMDAAELQCDHCQANQLKFIKDCGILNQITVPIPSNQPSDQPNVVGYIKAMVGLNESNVEKIMAGCKEEESMKGKYLAESYILRAYMNTVALSSPTNLDREYPKDLRRMNELIWDEKTPEKIKFNALLCRANMYNRQQKYNDAESELNAIEKKYNRNNSMVYIIKSGALMTLAHSKPEFLPALTKCCSLMPDVLELHMQLALAELADPPNPLLVISNPLYKLEEIVTRFPNEIDPIVCLAGIYAKLNLPQKATKILRKIEKKISGPYG